jgi:hypothetical protein
MIGREYFLPPTGFHLVENALAAKVKHFAGQSSGQTLRCHLYVMEGGVD